MQELMGVDKNQIHLINSILGYRGIYHIHEAKDCYMGKSLIAPRIPDLPPLYEPFPVGYEPTQDEQEQRILAFLQCFASCQFITSSAKAVGVPYSLLMIWISQHPKRDAFQHLMKIAQVEGKALYRDTAHSLAVQGNTAMLQHFLNEGNVTRITKAGEGMLEVQTESPESRVLGVIGAVLENAKELA